MTCLACAQLRGLSADCSSVRCQLDVYRHAGRPGIASARVQPGLINGYIDSALLIGYSNLSIFQFADFTSVSGNFYFLNAVCDLGRSVRLVLRQVCKLVTCLACAQLRGLSADRSSVRCQLDVYRHAGGPGIAAARVQPGFVDCHISRNSICIRNVLYIGTVRSFQLITVTDCCLYLVIDLRGYNFHIDRVSIVMHVGCTTRCLCNCVIESSFV